jgi:hypothetical protein
VSVGCAACVGFCVEGTLPLPLSEMPDTLDTLDTQNENTKRRTTVTSDISKTTLDSKAMLDQFMANKRKQRGPGGSGRLLFALDATASRQPAWNVARDLQAEMFWAAGEGLSVQLFFFRGHKHAFTKWVSSPETLVRVMQKIECIGGYTQISKVLRHALDEHVLSPIQALVFVGDSCEEELDELAGLASKLGAAKLPVFMFHEGEDHTVVESSDCSLKPEQQTCSGTVLFTVSQAFKTIADNSGGAYFKFDVNSPAAIAQFADTLNAVAKLAVGDSSAIAAITHKNGGKS